jgi:hypothetical protein
MNLNLTGLLVAAAGLAAILVDVFSKTIGLSHGQFGAKHVLLLVVGLGLLVAGATMARRTRPAR